MLLIAEELLLLCTDNVTGQKTIGGEKFEPALTGALLAELALLGRIRIGDPVGPRPERGRVLLADPAPVGDRLLDASLARLAELQGKKAKDLLGGLGQNKLIKGLPDMLRQRLVAAGVLTREDKRLLGLFTSTTFPEANPLPERDVRDRVAEAILRGREPDTRTATLIALLLAVGQLPKVLPGQDRRQLTSRAKAIADGELASTAVKQSIDEVTGAMSAVFAATTAASIAGS